MQAEFAIVHGGPSTAVKLRVEWSIVNCQWAMVNGQWAINVVYLGICSVGASCKSQKSKVKSQKCLPACLPSYRQAGRHSPFRVEPL